jgi:hypothetical protein
MFAPANLVHHQEFYEFLQEFDLAIKPHYFMQPAYSVPGAGPSAVTAKNIGRRLHSDRDDARERRRDTRFE